MKARLVFAIAFGAALVALPATALGSSAHVESNSQNFPDSTGEDAQAPDITSVQVSNDDAGMITIKVNISNRPALTSDMVVLVYLDTDQKATTGDSNLLGSDYVIQLVPGAVALFQWNGSDFTNAHTDLAPDPGHGFFSYKVIAKVKLTQTAYTVGAAKAGKAFQVSLAADESDTGGPVTKATVTCSAKVGGVSVRGTHSLANGVATCVFKLPATAKGKTLSGKISVTVQGATLAKTFSAKVH